MTHQTPDRLAPQQPQAWSVRDALIRVHFVCASLAVVQREADRARLALAHRPDISRDAIEHAVALEVMARAETEIVTRYLADLSDIRRCVANLPPTTGETIPADQHVIADVRQRLEQALHERDATARLNGYTSELFELQARQRVSAILAKYPAALARLAASKPQGN